MLKKEYFKNPTFILLAFIILAYVFSVLCRFYWVFWASEFNEYFFNNELMIISNDGYAFAEGARDMIAGFHQPNDLSYYGSSLSTLTYWFYKITPFSLESIFIYISTFLSSLVVIPLILIANEYKRPLMGFVAALLASIANSYYNRTMSGYYDTDMLVIVLAMMIVFFMIRLILKKDLLSLIALPLFVGIYLWWYPSSYTLNVALLGLFFIYTLVFHIKEKTLYMAIILASITLSNIAWFYQSAIIVILFSLFVLQNKRFSFALLGILGLATLVFLILSGGIDPILYQLKFYIFRSDESANLAQGFMYFNVNQTIQEVESIDLSIFMQRISGSELVFFVSLIGFIFLVRKHKSMILALPMLALGFLALKSGLRFTIYAVPVLALGFGFLMSLLQERKQKNNNTYWWANIGVFIFTFLSLIPMFYHINNYKAPTVFSQNEATKLDELKKIAQREDYVVAWWDYGYPIRYYSDVKTLADGGKHLGKDNFFPSFVLSKDQVAAANMARLSVEYTEKSFYAPLNDILKNDLLQAMMKDYNQNNVDLFLALLSKPDFKINTPKTRDVYIYMPARMSLIFSTVASFSFVDLETGKINKPFTFSAAYPLDVKNGEIYLSNGIALSDDFRSFKINNSIISVNSIIEINSIKQGEYKITPIDDTAQFYIFYLKDSTIPYAQFILMDKTMFNSAYVQMFFLGNYDKNLYDLVINARDAKVFKLKF
ncbi:TPA: peptide-binding protein [Campylobacter coli]|uniref:STT3 domain-containing protein n=1 Tax=Campylobacter coli TaxID=195 RepID=UPI001C8BA03F|nr:STT3 domain-containing protein [Campylobacter coli]ECL3101719.1 peptide-binding protein [Campylobacter coli]EEO8734353.1 peptide-binding protein [Campylobacter coli]MBX9221846.1 peptide-binding protein [Campylobacter coli]HEB7593913.1 peptide-binding protein [Campylobacter coli]HEB7604488.1 peptide-binding protein [Campylobacter coli]